MIDPPLTDDERAQLDALSGEPDLSEFPELSDEKWATARRGVFGGRNGSVLPLRLDPEVRTWLLGKGETADAAINRILRERMAAETGR